MYFRAEFERCSGLGKSIKGALRDNPASERRVGNGTQQVEAGRFAYLSPSCRAAKKMNSRGDTTCV